jgi:hypothetical protein
MTTVAKQLPTRFTVLRGMSIRSIDAEDHGDRFEWQANEARVPERMRSEARGIAATPLLVIMSVSILRSGGWPVRRCAVDARERGLRCQAGV